MSATTTPPGWVWLLVSAALVYVPAWLVEVGGWLLDTIRAGGDAIDGADFGEDD